MGHALSCTHCFQLHSQIAEFILLPICEEGSKRLLEAAVLRGNLLDRIMATYVSLAPESRQGLQ